MEEREKDWVEKNENGKKFLNKRKEKNKFLKIFATFTTEFTKF